MTPVRCLLLLGLGLIGLPATGQGCIQQAWEPDTTILVGFLERRMDPGRPNYESVEREDEAEIYLYVRIGQPYCVAEEHDRPKADLVQLVLDRAGYDVLSPLVGRRIRLRGLMFEAHTGHHHAPQLLRDVVLLRDD